MTEIGNEAALRTLPLVVEESVAVVVMEHEHRHETN